MLSEQLQAGSITFQEIFNFAWNRLVTEKHPKCVREGTNTCMYRGPEDRRCIIGAMFPDEEYSDRWDRESVRSNEVVFALNWDKKYKELLNDLQSCHDSVDTKEFTDNVAEELQVVASKYKLEVPNAQ